MLIEPTYDELKETVRALRNKLPQEPVSEHINAPKGAEYFIDSLYYKIGVHGKAFRFTGEEWTLSGKTASFVERHSRIDNVQY